MKQSNKKIIIYIIIIICIIVIHYLFTREEEYVENINILTTYEGNSEEENLAETEEKIQEKNKIIIHVSGAVKNAGIYELEEGSRVAAGIEAAGGLTEEAQTDNINLAYVLEDGMKIHIPTKGETNNEIQDNTNQYITKENSNTQSTQNSKEKININTATQVELETLPGIGPSTASKIISYRKENGKFNKIEDIKKVSGIGENKYAKIKDFIKI